MTGLPESLCAFAQPDLHLAVARMIRRRSTHPADVRDFAFEGIDLTRVRRVLDLGCGFGFVVETIAPRLPADARWTGIDACEANRAPFLARVASAGRQGEFIAMPVEDRLPWPAASFDLVLCSYSLYFFPQVLPAVARLLAPDGILVALTHRLGSLETLFAVCGIDPGRALLPRLIERFPAERGRRMLGEHFTQVTKRDYANALRFTRADASDLLLYARFKLPFLIPGASSVQDLPDDIRRAVERFLAGHDEVMLEKDDACFHARGPRG